MKPTKKETLLNLIDQLMELRMYNETMSEHTESMELPALRAAIVQTDQQLRKMEQTIRDVLARRNKLVRLPRDRYPL